MNNICILKNGLAVKLPEDIFQNLIYDIDGFLISFEFQKETSFVKYHFYYSDEFKNIRYNGKSYVPDGYYLEEKAILYFAYKQGTAFTQSIAPTPVELKENYCFKYIDFENNYPANIDDEVTVTSINSSLPNFIYEENKAVFKIIKNVDNTPKLYYLKSNKKIDFPIKNEIGNGFVSYELSQINDFLHPDRDYNTKALGYFYQKNFSERVSGWIATTDTIQKMDRITTLITLRINQIRIEIFPLLTDYWGIIDGVGTQQPGFTLADLDTNLLRILYEIKKGWAMYYFPNNPSLNTYSPILPNDGYYPDYEAFSKYYSSLVNFYSSCYRIKPLLLNETNDDKKLELLIKCLGPSSLQVIPIDLRIDILIGFAKNKIYEDKENLVLKIIESIDPADSTYFLAKLQSTILKEKNENKTLFETLYDKINDQILWIGKDNRKALMLKLFNLWYVSEFNPSFNTNDFEDDVTNYDNIELGLLGYTSNTVMLNYNHEKSFGFYTDNMSFNFSDRKIEVYEDKQEVVKTSPNYGNDYQTEKVTTVPKLVGTYNYFQAISLSDYKENDVAIKIPLVDLNQNGQNVTALLPLFYLKYMDDFGDNEDLWTGIGLAFDVALTFTGIGNLSKLRHLRHVGKFGRAFRAWRTGTQTSETLFILKGIWSSAQGIGALLEISSSFVSIYLTYTTNNCNDYRNQVNQNINDNTPNGQLPDDSAQSDEFKRCKQLDQILFWIQIGSLGLDVLASKMIKKHARKLEDLGYPASWDVGDFLQLKQKFQGINAAGLDNFQSFINQIPTSFRSNVESKLLSYTSDQRILFLDDFMDANITDEFWQKMIQNGGEAMDNWKNLRIHNVNDAKSLEIIFDTTLTNRYTQYYSYPSLKAQILKFDDEARRLFMQSPLSQVTPLPGTGYLNAWLKMQKNGTLGNFQTESFLRKFDDFSDELVEKAIHEIAHSGQRGKDVRRLIQANPEDIINQLKPILEDPYRLWSSKELFSPAWLRWRKSYFFKHVTFLGRKFEGIVSARFAVRNSTEYNALQNWMSSNSIAKNLDDYDLITNVQLKYNSAGDYFIADQVFVKFTTDQYGKKKISDIIVIETKLKQTTATSLNQKGAINAAYDNNFSGFELRNNNRKLKFEKKFNINKTNGDFKFDGQPTIIKASDLDSGDEISDFKRLTNLDNN
ncbi:hypothetical protein [uncultured Flavobacterium sp.]|uniref:hypothetical protein n=1 Tax=uncultured Flavobacterium sp. TaxID=165435 RepID=UPI0030C7D8B1